MGFGDFSVLGCMGCLGLALFGLISCSFVPIRPFLMFSFTLSFELCSSGSEISCFRNSLSLCSLISQDLGLVLLAFLHFSQESCWLGLVCRFCTVRPFGVFLYKFLSELLSLLGVLLSFASRQDFFV